MERPRITIGGKKLADVISVWLLDIPPWMWGKDPAYERLRAQRRHQPEDEPSPRHEVARHIAAKVEKLGWEVSYPEPGVPFRTAPWQRDEEKD